MTSPSFSRRRFLLTAAVAATVVPFLGHAEAARAAALKPLPVTHPTAKALSYVLDASKVTAPAYKKGSNCANCQFFTAGTGACSLFPGFSVAPKGWCSAWAKRAA
jgi:hypothetical protein